MAATTSRLKESCTQNIALSPLYTETHVTALHFFEGVLIAGEGPYINVYDTETREQLLHHRLFEGTNVHGFRVPHRGSPTSPSSKRVAAFGGRSLRIFQLNDTWGIDDPSDVIDFEDWVWDVRWFYNEQIEDDSIAVILGHNVVLFWDWRHHIPLQTIQCHDQCILYSATLIGSCLQTLTVAAGTVMGDVLVWCAAAQEKNSCRKRVIHRLQGHEGVIFCVAYNPTLRVLCSTSDDRSLRLWRLVVAVPTGCELNVEAWQAASFQLANILYGHTARVWKALPLNHCLISAGEDSLLCIWDYSGTVLQKVRAHNGGSIWSLAADHKGSCVVSRASGGSDAAIRIWPVTRDALSASTTSVNVPLPRGLCPDEVRRLVKPDFPRTVGLLDIHHLLVMTNEGVLYCHSRITGQWSVLLNDPTYHSYSLMVPAPWGRHVALGSLSGQVLIIDTNQCDGLIQAFQCVREQVYSDKVLAITWLDKKHVLTCGSQGNMLLWRFCDSGGCLQLALQLHFRLPPCRQRWTSAAVLLSKSSLLVCGDRGGSVHVYLGSGRPHEEEQPTHAPVQTFPRIHSKSGVSDIQVHNDLIYTAGRDGLIHIFFLKNGDHLEETRSIKASGGLDWIAKLVFVRGSMIVLGFHTKNFVVWSWDQQRPVISIPCGGGHRSWDFKLEGDSVRLAYIRAGEVHENEVKALFRVPPVLKPSLHARSICTIKHLFSIIRNSEPIHVVATGSEDISIKVGAVNCGPQPPIRSLLLTLQGHISSIRCMALCSIKRSAKMGAHCHQRLWKSEWKPSKKSTTSSQLLMFSAGGRAQIKVWLLTPEPTGHEDGELCSFQLIASHLLRGPDKHRRKPWCEPALIVDPETRYMDFTSLAVCEINASLPSCLFLAIGACSDGFIRVFGLNLSLRRLRLLATLSYHEHCLLRTVHFFIRNEGLIELILVSAATDGRLAFWNLTDLGIAFADAEIRESLKPKRSLLRVDTTLEEEEAESDDTSSVQTNGSTLSNMTLQPPSFERQAILVDKRDVGIVESPTFYDKICTHPWDQPTSPIAKPKTAPFKDACEVLRVGATLGTTSSDDSDSGRQNLGDKTAPFFVLGAHQSGINSLLIQPITGDTILVVSGGDDNALHLALARVYPCAPLPDICVDILATCNRPSAHAAQITDVKFLPNNILISVSVDQRVNIWHWRYKAPSELTLHLAASKVSSVADIACMDVWPDNSSKIQGGSFIIGVAGEGMEIFECRLPQPQVERLI